MTAPGATMANWPCGDTAACPGGGCSWWCGTGPGRGAYACNAVAPGAGASSMASSPAAVNEDDGGATDDDDGDFVPAYRAHRAKMGYDSSYGTPEERAEAVRKVTLSGDMASARGTVRALCEVSVTWHVAGGTAGAHRSGQTCCPRGQ